MSQTSVVRVRFRNEEGMHPDTASMFCYTYPVLVFLNEILIYLHFAYSIYLIKMSNVHTYGLNVMRTSITSPYLYRWRCSYLLSAKVNKHAWFNLCCELYNRPTSL